jgi:hypothetical protein
MSPPGGVGELLIEYRGRRGIMGSWDVGL